MELGSLFGVDPARRYPLWKPVSVDATAPAFLQEMGVVVAAHEGQIVQVSRPAINQIDDVMPVAPLRRMIATRKEHPPSLAINAMV